MDINRSNKFWYKSQFKADLLKVEDVGDLSMDCLSQYFLFKSLVFIDFFTTLHPTGNVFLDQNKRAKY